MSRIVYVNGEFVAADQARVSIFDRGYIFGDGVYEVVPVINGKLVDKAYFLERLDRSLSELQIAWPCSKEDALAMMGELISRNELSEGVVYCQVTRGVAERDFTFPEDCEPAFIAFTTVMDLLDNPAAETGIDVLTTEDLRWKRRDIKSINLLGQVLAKQDVASRGGKEGWMIEDGFVTEGVSSSAYIVKDKKIITRQLSNDILPGIRRRTLLEISAELGIEIEQRPFTVAEALAADEAFISSATTITLGVVSLDGQKIGDGTPGPVTRRLREAYKQRLIAEAAEG